MTLRIIKEQSLEWQSKILINFIDFHKAFESINRKNLWKIAGLYGIPDKLLKAMKLFFKVTTVRMWTELISINRGVRQGCILSLTLFIIVNDWIVQRYLKGETGIYWNTFSHLKIWNMLITSVYLFIIIKTKTYVKKDEEIGKGVWELWPEKSAYEG